MSTHGHPHSNDAIEHIASRTATHARHAAEQKTKRRFSYVRVQTDGARDDYFDFSQALPPYEYAVVDGEFRLCPRPNDLVRHLRTEAGKCNWFYDLVKRGKEIRRMRRKVKKSAIFERCTVTDSPYLAKYYQSEIGTGRDPRPEAAAVERAWLNMMVPYVSDVRHLKAIARHTATRVPHSDVVMSRQAGDGSGTRIGPSRLGYAGPWSTMVDRQVRCGAIISEEKRRCSPRTSAPFERVMVRTQYPST